jgi:hypothetical protein
MEPFDFDKLIREKVSEEGNIHSVESREAKPVIWKEIQDKQKKGGYVSWYHLAASILLLIVGFSIILFKVQRHYIDENEALYKKIEQLENDFSERVSLINNKDEQIQELTSGIDDLEKKIKGLSKQQIVKSEPRIIYVKDTVYQRTIEYVVYQPEEDAEILETDEPVTRDEPEVVRTSIITESNIYPPRKSKESSDESEKIKISFGNYIAKEN